MKLDIDGVILKDGKRIFRYPEQCFYQEKNKIELWNEMPLKKIACWFKKSITHTFKMEPRIPYEIATILTTNGYKNV